MSEHLSTQEFVDAIDGTLPDARRAHLTSCGVCAREVAELGGLTLETRRALVVPEPSPLFWDHFSARVRAATDAQVIRPLSWWDRAWRPVIAISAVAAALMLAVFVARPEPTKPVDVATTATSLVTPEQVLDDASMEFMVQIAADVSNEELQAARPRKAATADAIDELTPEQQAAFIRLIKAEIGEQQ
jgi:hypothetical protein